MKRLSLTYWRAYLWARRYGEKKDVAALFALHARQIGLLRPSRTSYENWLAQEALYYHQYLKLIP